MADEQRAYTSLEICAGGGGQALGLEQAGFEPKMLIEYDQRACATLRHNRPTWNVVEADLRHFSLGDHPVLAGVDLLAGGVPCTPYSVAGHQLGADDERDLLGVAIGMAAELRPRAIMIENVRQLLVSEKFKTRREAVNKELLDLGYQYEWRILDAQHFGVSQERQRCVLVALSADAFFHFRWPTPSASTPPTVGQLLGSSMAKRGWAGAAAWTQLANGLAPTLVGGSKKHGGPDLGPEGAKARWAKMGVNGNAIAEGDLEPDPDFVLQFNVGRKGRKGLPKLTVAQTAQLQGFPLSWEFQGPKTERYKQVGNAFPPPMAAAVGREIVAALNAEDGTLSEVA